MSGEHSPTPSPPQPQTIGLLLGTLLLISALAAILVATVVTDRLTDNLRDERDTEIAPLQRRLDLVQGGLYRLHVEARIYALAGDQRARDLYLSSRTGLSAQLDQLLRLAERRGFGAEADDVAESIEVSLASPDAVVEARNRGDLNETLAQLAQTDQAAVDDVSVKAATLDQFITAENLRIGREIDDAEERELVVTVLSVAIGAIAASFVVWLALRNRGLARYLASERTRFASIVESTSFPVYQVDRSGCIEHMNPAGERLLGHASSEILGKPMHAIVHPHHADDATPDETCPMHGLGLRGRRRSTVIDQFVRSDGSLIDVEITSSPIVLPHGAVAGAVVVLQDVTERLRQEKMKDDFIGFASHELRSPLTTINGMAKWLARDMAQDRARFTEDEQEAIEALGQGADRMRGIVELFLDLTRIDAGRLEVEPQEVDFGRLLGDEVEALGRRSPQAMVEVSLPAERIAGWSDPQRLRQVLVNLLDNAVKYGGSPPHVAASVESAGHNVQFRVRDNGHGIAEADRARIFDRFYKGDGVKGKGLGIGLFVSREIATLLGGALTFDSSPSGTEFRLSVPLNVTSAGHSSNGSGHKPRESVTQGTAGRSG